MSRSPQNIEPHNRLIYRTDSLLSRQTVYFRKARVLLTINCVLFESKRWSDFAFRRNSNNTSRVTILFELFFVFSNTNLNDLDILFHEIYTHIWYRPNYVDFRLCRFLIITLCASRNVIYLWSERELLFINSVSVILGCENKELHCSQWNFLQLYIWKLARAFIWPPKKPRRIYE